MIRRPPLRVLVPALLIVLGVILTAGSFVHETVVDAEHIELTTRTQVKFLGVLATALVEEAFRHGNPNAVQSMIQLFATENNIENVTIVDDIDHVVYSSHPRLQPGEPVLGESGDSPFSSQELKAIRSTMSGKTILSAERSLVFGAFPFRISDRMNGKGFILGPSRIGILLIEGNVADQRINADRFTMSRYGSILVFLVLAIAFVWYPLNYFITDRVQRLVATIRRFGQGDLTASAGLKGTDEFALLSQAFDRMATELRIKEEIGRSVETELRQAVNSRDEFLSVASHELKTPLAALKLQLQMSQRALERNFEPSKNNLSLLAGFKMAIRQVDSLTDLVNDLLDVSRIQAGQSRTIREAVHLSALVKETVEAQAGPLAVAKCMVALTLDDEVIGHWDNLRIQQVLNNLLGNVIKHAPGSEVRIKTEKRDENVVLVVEDNGPGIPPELHTKIFERFERGESSRYVSGLGLGLYLVKEIVQAHGGTINVESRPGFGAKFIIDLPLVSPLAMASPRRERELA